MGFKRIMKNLVLLQLLVISLPPPVFSRQDLQKEYVQVVNVELILRVLKDGLPVAGLKKSDFSLTEDGEKSEINGFFEIHRRIAHAGEEKKQPQPPRLYLLFFWVDNPAADVEGVLARFFSSVYREGDRVLLSTPLKIFELPTRQDIASMTGAFLEQWRQEARERLATRLQFHGNLNRLLEDLVDKLFKRIVEYVAKEKRAKALGLENTYNVEEDNAKKHDISAFLAQYASAVQEYHVREFSPDMTAFEAMARSMIPGNYDKFALVFFQHDSLPLFDIANVRGFCMTRQIPENITDELAQAMAKIEEQRKSSFDVRLFTEQLKSLFIQANAQFHLLSLNPFKNDEHANVNSFFSLTKNQEVFSKWDHVMREISLSTGGLRLDGSRMVDALDRVASFEDIYYHITYAPREQGAKKRKINIRVDQPGMRVIYGRTAEMNEMPQVKIAELSATGQLIRLGLVDFYAISKDGVPTGFVNVHVTGRQAGNEPSLLLLSQDSETVGRLEFPLAFPQAGGWYLEVQVIDQITGHQDVKKAMVEIAAAVSAPAPGSDPDSALSALLSRAAAYAERLKKAAFHFICRESVTENTLSASGEKIRMPVTARTYWVYDYQIIARNGKIQESRLLLEKNREKLHREKAKLETVFQSYFSFYMPVTLLAREKQPLYRYRLVDKEIINNKSVWHIAVVRRFPHSIPWGEIWVGEEDGIVWKIQLDQTSIVGFEKLAQKAIDRDLLPDITTIHEYELKQKGMCFPSKTTFVERYKTYEGATKKKVSGAETEMVGGEQSSPERSRTYFEYKDYRFFSVSTSVTEEIG